MQKNLIFQPDFDTLVEKWKNMDRSNDEKRASASQFYDEEIFPRIKEVFLSKPENHPPKGKEYHGLILTVGLSPEPLILSMCALNPDQFALHTGNKKISSPNRKRSEN